MEKRQAGPSHYVAKRVLLRALAYLFCIVVALSAFFPLYSMLISSTHTSYNIVTRLNLLPGGAFGQNYARLTRSINIWRGFANSLVLACVSVAATLYLSALCGYGFSKFRFRGRGVLFAFVVVMMMLPGQIGIIGFYQQLDAMRLLNTYTALVLKGAANCFCVFLFKQYLDACLPNEMIEAALMDGCGELRIFHHIALPMMRPILVAQGVMSFIGSWNSYLTPLIVLFDKDKMTLPLLIATVRDAMHAEYGAQFAGMLITVLPLIVLFCFASKIIMEEISVGAGIKG